MGAGFLFFISVIGILAKDEEFICNVAAANLDNRSSTPIWDQTPLPPHLISTETSNYRLTGISFRSSGFHGVS
jgi:hypothetical protein